MTAKEVIKLIEEAGWKLYSVNGSHHQFKHPNRKGKVTVAIHKGDIPPGTLNSILKQAGLR